MTNDGVGSVKDDGPGSAGLKAAVKGLIPRWVVIRRLRQSTSRSILLTFDDGPHSEVTPAVLERLSAYDARAVFFVIGRRAKKLVPLLKRITASGHVIGNHSHLHRDRYVLPDLPQASFVSYYRDCARCQRVVAASGADARLFRPPGGRLTLTTMTVPKLLGLRCVTWSQEVKDWAFRHPDEARAGANQLLERVRPGDIVLLHDDNSNVIPMLDVMLPALRSRGYDLHNGVDRL